MSKEYLYKTATELAIIKQEMLRQQHELELHRQKMRDFYLYASAMDAESLLPKARKIKCVKCKKVIAINPPEEQWYSGLKDREKFYCPTCWKIRKLKE
ncbi:MAG: hypothetical protein ACTSR0_06040 [Candidatus Asgardarchaeia archaeon]